MGRTNKRQFGFYRLVLLSIIFLFSSAIVGCGGGTQGTQTGERVLIRGQIVDTNGAPAANTQVTLANHPSGITSTTNESGEFVLDVENVAPGTSTAEFIIENDSLSNRLVLEQIPEGTNKISLVAEVTPKSSSARLVSVEFNDENNIRQDNDPIIEDEENSNDTNEPKDNKSPKKPKKKKPKATPAPTPEVSPPLIEPTPEPTPTPELPARILPPAAVVSAMHDDLATIEWKKSEGAASYRIYTSLTLDGEFEFITEINGSNTFDDNTEHSEYFYVRISAVDSEGTESDLSPAHLVYPGADYDRSGCVDDKDFMVFEDSYLSHESDGHYFKGGDFDLDGDISLDDFVNYSKWHGKCKDLGIIEKEKLDPGLCDDEDDDLECEG